ncbi:glycosyltransferase family 4 protein [Flavitalea flava]
MSGVTYFYRKKNPLFFSIEQVFERIAERMAEDFRDEFTVRQVTLSHPSKLSEIFPNILFTRRRQNDINHVTGDIHYTILGCSRKKVNILTIHDCVLLHRFTRRDPRFWIIKWLWHEWPARKADYVTVISESTKKDLLRFTRCPPGKIRVIPNFIDPAFQPAPYIFSAQCPRILFVGTTANKNLERLAAALEGIKAELDIIGDLTEVQSACLKRHGIVYHQSSGLSREGLLRHYTACDLLAFPSTYEGFGLPVIEGQAVGRPVLTSNLSPMKEVAGNGACLIDPYNVDSIRQGLLRVINDKTYRAQLIESGLTNAARFSLNSVVRQYAELYRELLKQKDRTPYASLS